MLTLRAFGFLDLRDERGEPLSRILAQPKRSALLAYLALAHPGELCRRDQLLALFWPEVDQPQGRHGLSQALSFLRQHGCQAVLMVRGTEEVGVDASLLQTDVRIFEEALEAGDWSLALETYRGDLMAGFHVPSAPAFVDWMDRERWRLREAAADAAWRLTHQLLVAGQSVEAERAAERALDFVATDESPVRRFMEALTRAGDRAGALNFYERFVAMLAQELSVEPAPETSALVEAIRNGEHSASVDPTPIHRPPSLAGSGRATRPSLSPPPPPRALPADPEPTFSAPAPRETDPPTDGAPPGRKRFLLRAAGTLALMAAAVAVTLFVTRMPRSLGADLGDLERVAVFPFENLSGYPVLDGIGSYAAHWITESLGRMTEVRTVAANTVRHESMARADESPRSIAEGLGATRTVTGVVALRGDSVELRAEVSRVESGEVLYSVVAVGAAERPEDALVALRDRVIGALAVSSTWSRSQFPQAPPTYAAYQAMERGWDRLAARDHQGAAPLFLGAYAADTTLLSALWWANVALDGMEGQRARQDSILGILRGRRNDLSPAELLQLDWYSAEDLQGRLRALRALFARDPEAWAYHLATALLECGRTEEAHQTMQQARLEGLTAQRWPQVWRTLAWLDHLEGHYQEEFTTATRGLATFPGDLELLRFEASALVAMGDLGAADSLALLVSAMSPELGNDPGRVLGILSRELAYFGHRPEAARVAGMSVNWMRRWSAGTAPPGMAWALLQAGRTQEALEAARASVEAAPDDPYALGALGVASALLRDRAGAEEAAAELARTDRNGLGIFYQAAVVAHLGRIGEATRLLDDALRKGAPYDRIFEHNVFGPLWGDPRYERVVTPRG